MKQSISDAFSSSVKEVLVSLCNCDVTIDDPQDINLSNTIGDINIILEINGQLRGQIIYIMSDSFALEIASHMMDLQITEIDDLTLSALSEVGNIITGNASTKLSEMGYYCETTIPKVIIGKEKALKLYNNNALMISAFTTFGNISIAIITRD